MASPFQQQALQRKFIYIGLILALFTAAFAWRRTFIEPLAEQLAIREQDRGEVELTGSLVRLSLTGSRGLATCVLWMSAIETQKKNQWNELEVLVRSMTQLQPHFITPWLFQSWNLAYNVSVESDRVRDKFFYVTRGVQLLAEGEKKNRNYPDLRFYIGFYNQHKVCQSDETNSVRSLFQLSCIPHNERDPARFQVVGPDGKEIAWSDFSRYKLEHPDDKTTARRIDDAVREFEDFCLKHPHLIRRLREGMRQDTRLQQQRQFTCESVEAVLKFLADNRRVPSLYKEPKPAVPGNWDREAKAELLRIAERYPVMPPPRTGDYAVPPPQVVFDPNELTWDSTLDDMFDGFVNARAWYAYAQEPIPPADEYPGSNQPPQDPRVQRRPRNITTLIFRNYPAQGHRYHAERLQQEGWFDEEGYRINGWFDNDNFSDDKPAVIGGYYKGEKGNELPRVDVARLEPRPWSREAWEKAADAWADHGYRNHLLFLDETQEANMKARAAAFREKYNLGPHGGPPPQMREESLSDADREGFKAARFLQEYDIYRQMSNFHHHYVRSAAERKAETVQARKVLFDADTLRLKYLFKDAMKMMERPDAMIGWRDKVMLTTKVVDGKPIRVLSDWGKDNACQEFGFESQLKYFFLFNETDGPSARQGLLDCLEAINLAGRTAEMAANGILIPVTIPVRQMNTKPIPDFNLLVGPFDGKDDEGKPLVEEFTRDQTYQRRGVKNPNAKPEPTPDQDNPEKPAEK